MADCVKLPHTSKLAAFINRIAGARPATETDIGEKTMSLAKIVWALSALAAIVLAFINTGYDAAILSILGLVCGWFLDHDHRRGVIIAAVFLMVGGQNALGGIPGIGGIATNILASLGAVFGGASVMAIVRTLVERILQSNVKASTS